MSLELYLNLSSRTARLSDPYAAEFTWPLPEPVHLTPLVGYKWTLALTAAYLPIELLTNFVPRPPNSSAFRVTFAATGVAELSFSFGESGEAPPRRIETGDLVDWVNARRLEDAYRGSRRKKKFEKKNFFYIDRFGRARLTFSLVRAQRFVELQMNNQRPPGFSVTFSRALACQLGMRADFAYVETTRSVVLPDPWGGRRIFFLRGSI